MKRVILGGIAGAVVLYFWLFAAWVVLPLHSDIESLPDEAPIVDALKHTATPSGTYFLPGTGDLDPMSDEYAALHEAGPVGLLFYHAEGFKPMTGGTFAVAIAGDLIIGLLCAWLVWQARLTATTFFHRLVIVVVVGVIVTITADISMWNWMHFHTPWTRAMVIERLVGALLMGLPIAAIVKAPADGGAGAAVPANPQAPAPAASAAAQADA